MITNQQIANGLVQLGFTSGWAFSEADYNNPLLWEHDVPLPPLDDVLAAAAVYESAMQAQAAASAAAREAAIAHAKSLGFTDEMIAVMYPGLTV